MDVKVRKLKTIQSQDQENQHPLKGKASILPGKRQGLTVRGALGEINENIQRLPDVVCSKGSIEEKKAAIKCAGSNYGHIQSKIDTGLSNKANTIRPVLRREESTASHAARAAKSKLISLKKETEITTKKSEIKEVKTVTIVETKVLEENAKVKDEVVSLDKLCLASVSEQDLLPPKVEDIDARDKDCPLLLSIYIKDIYNYLGELEDKYIIKKDYLSKQAMITGSMRATLIDWLVEVHQQFTLVLETLHLTVNIIDRYLQATNNVERSRLQLVGVTAMMIASKYEEIYPPDVSDFVFITDNAYTKTDLFQCEREIMAKLDFCLAKPTPLQFLRRFVKAARGTSVSHHLGKYFVELCFVNYSMVQYKPSELAAASVCLSLHLLTKRPMEKIWTQTMEYYSKYKLAHIIPIITKIAHIVYTVEDSKHKAVFNKYTIALNAKVSSLAQLRGHSLKALADQFKE